MKCKYCGVTLPDEAAYCSACGKKLVCESRCHLTKRLKGEGSITKLPNRRNPYWARLPAAYDSATGHVVRKSVGMFATKAEANRALWEAIYAPKPKAATMPTLQDMWDRFVSSNYYDQLSHGAQGSHKSAWKHLSVHANTPICDINKDTFQQVVDAMAKKGLKRDTQNKVKSLSSLICQDAMGLNLIAVNFGRLVQLPKQDTTPPPPFSNKNLKELWKCADAGNITAIIVIILCYTGMRPSELFHVRIENIHFTDFYAYIIGGSKTEAGIDRLIPLPPVIRPFITALIDGRKDGYLLLTSKGKPYRLDNWRPRQFNPLMEALCLPDHVPYSCRHTYANLQKRRKVDPTVMMEIMGHADYAVTVEHYQSTTEEDIATICSAVEGMTRPE